MNDAVVFCTSHIDNDPLRYQEWIAYYSRLFDGHGIDLLMVNDGPAATAIDLKGCRLETFPEYLGRPHTFAMPGWRRSFRRGVSIRVNQYAWGAHVESDCFILPSGLQEFLYYLRRPGFYCGWCHVYGFMETALQILNWHDVCRYYWDRWGLPDGSLNPATLYEHCIIEREIEARFHPMPILQGERLEGDHGRVRPYHTYLAQCRLGNLRALMPDEPLFR